MAEQRKSGLARALFCVRLLDQQGETTAEQRMAFLVGACIASDLDPWVKTWCFSKPSSDYRQRRTPGMRGDGRSINNQLDAVICSADEIEAAFLRGVIANHLLLAHFSVDAQRMKPLRSNSKVIEN